jgi:hypothetical protein
MAAEETVATLIAQLGNINRDDPRAALEQIDEILRRGAGFESTSTTSPKNHINKDGNSSSNGGRFAESKGSRNIETLEPGKQKHEEVGLNENNEENEEDEDEDSDSESTVSSITDPTYQEMKKNFEQEFQASTTAAIGMPRPSALQKYAHSTARSSATNFQSPVDLDPKATTTTDASAPQDIKKTSKDGGERTMTPPTDTIHVTKSSTNKENSTKHRPTVADLVNVATSGGPAFLERFERLIAPKPDDVSLTHSAEIEQKIKKWDDMSTGVVPTGAADKEEISKSPLSGEATETSPPGITFNEGSSPNLRRAHPWDASMPARMGKVSVRDTSMESADGVEAQFEPKYPSAKLSPDRSDISPVRRMRKDRLSREMKKTTGGSNVDQPHLPRLDEGSFSTMSSRQQAATKSLSEDFDSAWVNLPSSSYFRNSNSPVADVTDNFRKPARGIPNARCSPLNNETYASSIEGFEAQNQHDADNTGIVREQNQSNEYCEQEVEVKYLPKVSQRHDLQTISPRSEDEPPSRDYVYTPQYKDNAVHVMNTQTNRGNDVGRSHSSDTIRLANSSESSGNSKPRNRGLRAFLKRKQASKAPQPNDIISTGSRRFRDYGSRPLQKEVDCAGAHSRDGEEPVMVTTTGLGRKSARSRSPHDRSRARSLENIRNPNIARKFSRLLRVYDDLEETKPVYKI